MRKTKASTAQRRKDLPVVTRRVPDDTRTALVAAAAGRCEFLGCHKYLFAHHVTKSVGYFGNFAHIRAFSPGGPRAGSRAQRARVDLHAIQNLMLLCGACHKLVDTDVRAYSIARLQAWKRQHEEHVDYLLGLPKENEASVVEIWTSVSSPPVVHSPAKIVAALLPLYPSRIHNCLIDLASHNLSDLTLIHAAVEQINTEVGRLFATGGERPTHIAVFGITNIPLLVYLGAKLGDRQDALLFQYHRDTKSWKWKDGRGRARYGVRRVRQGTDPKRVVVVLALSGAVDMRELPEELDASHTVYMITLIGATPNTGFLRTKADLDRFRECYRQFLSQLQADHGSLAEIAVVPAVPIPVALSLGMDRLPKVAPALNVYDLDKNRPGARRYQLVLRVP